MTGNLTIDKASMNISYFLYTIRLIAMNGGRISRGDFGRQMAEFIGVPAQNGGRENRTPYNKSKLPRYFGFADIETDAARNSFLVLTYRGQKLAGYISEKGNAAAAEKYYINPLYRDDFIDLIFESVIFDSFGKNNCGAEQSNTDVEPPKIVFKTLQELQYATAEEICYVIFGLNRGRFQTFEEAIAEIRQNRACFQYDYSQVMEKWEITNIVNDCKIINLFTDDSIRLLTSARDEKTGKAFYRLSPDLSQRHLDQIRTINAIYQPLRLLVYTDGDGSTAHEWVNNAVLGRVSDSSFVFRFDGRDGGLCGSSDSGSFVPGAFEEALLKAFQHEKKNVFLVLSHITEEQLPELLGRYAPLLKRVDDLSSGRHGWSAEPVEDADVYDYLTADCRQAGQVLPEGKVLIPSNLHMVGMIMNHLTGSGQFDYEFTRAMVRAGETEGPDGGPSPDRDFDRAERLAGGANTLLYGVPGSGKSWTIEHEYCHAGSAVVRLIFHPDYTNADFIGQILPAVGADKLVTYEFTPGPFTAILRDAYVNPMREYILIIEEINRGNAPAIFGEVFQLLDRTVGPKTEEGIVYPAGTSEYGVTHQYMAGYIYGDPAHKVRIPSNLSIVGTMNTSDQNVFTLDTAFQRRWRMRLIENDFSRVRDSLADAEILDTGVTWRRFCETVNAIILGSRSRMASAEDKRMGAYFIHESEIAFDRGALPSQGSAGLRAEHDALLEDERSGGLTDEKRRRLAEIRSALVHNRMFPEKVIKYLWDDAFKFNPEALFDTEHMKSLEQVIRAFADSEGRGRFHIFKQAVRSQLYPDGQP